jgi:hypothetical protein
MLYLTTDQNLLLTRGDSIVAKVLAKNALGTGPYSAETDGSKKVETKPLKPNSPVRDWSKTPNGLPMAMLLTLSGNDNAGSSSLTVNLQTDNLSGGSTWVDLLDEVTSATQLSFIHEATVTEGETYLFRFRLANKYGYGDFSDSLEIKASTTPDQISTITTSLIDTALKIKWNAPNDNGDAIEAYQILILNKNNEVIEDLANCNGQEEAIKDVLECFIPFQHLRYAPFSYILDDNVSLKIRARNSFGFGSESAIHITTVSMQTEPGPVTQLQKHSR